MLKGTPIKGYEHEYDIYPNGKILSKLTDMYIKQTVNGKGYLTVMLYKDGKGKSYQVHVLVAEHFIPNPDNLPVVNHMDGNKQNPDVSNLEWCTFSENTLHAHRTGLIKKTSNKQVIRISPSGKVEIFATLTEAAEKSGTTKCNISACCKGKRKSAGGYKWQYAE